MAKTYIEARNPNARPLDEQKQSLPEYVVSRLPTGASRDLGRMVTHGLARTGNTILRTLDIPNRVFGNTRSRLQDVYEASERNMQRDRYEDPGAVTQLGEAAVNLATSAGVLGRAMAPVFGADTAADTLEIGRRLGNGELESAGAGLAHGAKDTAIWTLAPQLVASMFPKSWQFVGRTVGGAVAGTASSNLAIDTYRSLGADISPEEQRKAAIHAAWMVPLLGMLKMGGKRREEAMALLRKARPDLNGITRTTSGNARSAEKVIEVLENEFDDPKSQKIALQWVARKGANLPDDIAAIKDALVVASKVRGVDPMQMSPAEFLSNPQYAKFLPKPDPKDVKAFSNMRRYPEGVVGFDVKDDAEGRQATREMINAYMSPSSNPWCLAKGNGAGKLTEDAEGYWNRHTAVPKQIFFQNIDGHLELLAFRATGHGAEGRQEYWDTSDAPHAGIPLKQKIPGDPLGRYRMMEFKPGEKDHKFEIPVHLSYGNYTYRYSTESEVEQDIRRFERRMNDPSASPELRADRKTEHDTVQAALEEYRKTRPSNTEVKGTFQDITPGKIYSGDVFRDGVSKVWTIGKNDSPLPPRMERTTGQVLPFEFNTWGSPPTPSEIKDTLSSARELRRVQESMPLPEGATEEDRRFALKDTDAIIKQAEDWLAKEFGDRSVLTEERKRSTKDGISTIVTKKYSSPEDWDYGTDKTEKPYEIEESRVLNPNLLRELGYDPDSEADMRRAVGEMSIAGWGEGLRTVPVKKTTFGSLNAVRTNASVDGQITDAGISNLSINGRVFTSVGEIEEAHRMGNITDTQYEKAMAKSRMETGGKPVRTATTVTYDKFGKHKVAEDVAVEGGDPVSRRKFNPLIPGAGRYDYEGYAYVPQDGETSYEVFDKDSRAFRKIRSTEYARDEHVSEWDPRDRYITTVYDNAGNPTERFIALEDVTGFGPYERNQSLLQRLEDGEWVRSISYNNRPRSNMFYEGSGLLPPPPEEIMPDPPPPAATHLDYDPFDIDGLPDLKGGDAGTRAAQKGGDVDYAAHDESTGPTDEQLQEAVEFLETVMEIGAPQNEWEQSIVQRTHDILAASIGMPREEREPENPAEDLRPHDPGVGTQADQDVDPEEEEQVKKDAEANDEQVSRDMENALQSGLDEDVRAANDAAKAEEESPASETGAGEQKPDAEKTPQELLKEAGEKAADAMPTVELPDDNQPAKEETPDGKTEQGNDVNAFVQGAKEETPEKPLTASDVHKGKAGIGLVGKTDIGLVGKGMNGPAIPQGMVMTGGQLHEQEERPEPEPQQQENGDLSWEEKFMQSHTNEDGSMDIEGKHLSAKKVELFKKKAEKNGESFLSYLGSRRYGRFV